MDGMKKWLAVVRVDQYTWLKDIGKKNGLKGSDLLREALDRVMQDESFVEGLAETRIKVQLQELNDEAAAIEEKREALKRQYKEVTGKERVKVQMG